MAIKSRGKLRSSCWLKVLVFGLISLWACLFFVQVSVLTHKNLLEADKTNTEIHQLQASVRSLELALQRSNKKTNATPNSLELALQKSNKKIDVLQKQMDGLLYKGVLAFLHIGKVGGTSFDELGAAIAKQTRYLYYGKAHFDWSHVDEVRNWRDNLPVEVVTLLREPVSRAVSHFYFWKSQDFARDHKMSNQSLSEYLLEGDMQNLLDSRDVWQDGQAGVSWLTGTHIGGWVYPRKTEGMKTQRERLSLNVTAMLPLAAARLRETKWFGILEDLNRSMILLQDAFNLTEVPSLPQKNQNPIQKPPTTAEEHEAMASLMPQDLWLYEYAKRLFEARWQHFQTGVYREPALPPPINLTCTSTRFLLECRSGPLAKFYSDGRQHPMKK